ncbi:hypothetical protein BSLG_005176 [Batrachochytrium salamandrivorans]|nr:hypothetical protein BSLG_005176 [Batrachochytrium salamandrivorans]
MSSADNWGRDTANATSGGGWSAAGSTTGAAGGGWSNAGSASGGARGGSSWSGAGSQSGAPSGPGAGGHDMGAQRQPRVDVEYTCGGTS